MKSTALIALLLLLSGCASVTLDRAGAKSLAAAGQATTSALQTQAADVKAAVQSVPIVVTVTAILDCRAAKPNLRQGCIDGAKASVDPNLTAQLKRITDVLEKRRTALAALNAVYVAFGGLVEYDARKETAAATENAFKEINGLLGMFSLSAISTTISKIAGAAAGAYADEKQAEAILETSKEIRTALEAMARALKAEDDMAAMSSLIAAMESERRRMEQASLEAGVLNAQGILQTFYGKASPGSTVVANIPAGAAPLANASAAAIVKASSGGRAEQLKSSYQKAVDTLSAVRAQHVKLEEKKPVDLAQVIAELKYLRDLYQSAK